MTNAEKVDEWLKENLHKYEDPFDCAVDCAVGLNLVAYCPVLNEHSAIPMWIHLVSSSYVNQCR